MIAEVIVDIANNNVDKIYDYCFLDTLDIQVGDRVLVQFGSRKIEGFVLKIKEHTELDMSKVKSIIARLDEKPLILSEMISLIDFMTRKFNLRVVDVIRLFLPVGVRNNEIKSKYVEYVSLNDNYLSVFNSLKKNAVKQREYIEYLLQNIRVQKTILNEKFSSVITNKFISLGILNIDKELENRSKVQFEEKKSKVTLTDTQKSVVDTIINCSQNNTFLLNGVTGSGKTEVYMNVIEHCISQNKTAIMLVPEISLTPQMIRVFSSRFGDNIGVLHSGLNRVSRFDEWQKIRRGEVKVVIGARSAIFAPLENVGVIIIDEEHDNSYYSENNPRYFTHDVAKFRAKYNNCPLILGSATPSIESYYSAKSGEYILLEMPNRINQKQLPELTIINMCDELRMGNTSIFSKKLVSELTKTLERKEQAMLFINRRGFNSFVRCSNCGYVPKCEHCDVSLVYHKFDNQLKCHYCNERYKLLNTCPVCGEKSFRYGAVGTQKVVEEIKKIFPLVRVFRLDNDTTISKEAYIKILSEFSNTSPSILVGTQMIAKGHDFPLVTLVGIIDADVSLHFSDYRANERTFNLITQVSGRAGRDKKSGKVVLQTYAPTHFVYKLASNYDYKTFFDKELNIRKVTKFPPFVKIVRILISGEDETKTLNYTHNYYKEIKELHQKYHNDFVYFDVMKSPIKRMNNKFRYQILMRIKLENFDNIISEIFTLDKKLKNSNFLSFVELDPQNLS